MNYTLAGNDLLSYIVQRLENEKPDWDKIVSKFMELPVSKSMKDRNNLHGLFAELHLRTSLENICAELPGRVISNPIKDGQMAGEFAAYFTRRGTIEFYDKDGAYSELDCLILVDGLPVLFEVTHGRGEANQKAKSEKISNKLRPLEDFFQRKDFGYVIVTAKDQLHPQSSQLQKIFVQWGGLLAPFCTNTILYGWEVDKMLQRYGIPVTDSPRSHYGLRMSESQLPHVLALSNMLAGPKQKPKHPANRNQHKTSKKAKRTQKEKGLHRGLHKRHSAEDVVLEHYLKRLEIRNETKQKGRRPSRKLRHALVALKAEGFDY